MVDTVKLDNNIFILFLNFVFPAMRVVKLVPTILKAMMMKKYLWLFKRQNLRHGKRPEPGSEVAVT